MISTCWSCTARPFAVADCCQGKRVDKFSVDYTILIRIGAALQVTVVIEVVSRHMTIVAIYLLPFNCTPCAAIEVYKEEHWLYFGGTCGINSPRLAYP